MPSTLLRPALEAAVRVARTGESGDPVQPAPAPLRRYLRFAKLPTPALDIARRVLDDDDDFRERVAEATTEAEVGEAAWLWLTRPHGWEQRIDAIRRAQQDAEVQAREERSERDAQRRLAGAEAAARRAEALAEARAREVEEVRSALTTEQARREALERQVEAVEARAARLTEDRSLAVRKLKDTEAELANRASDLRHARHQLRMLQSELQQALDAGVAGAAASPRPEPPPVPTATPDGLPRPVPSEASANSPSAVAAGLDRGAVAKTIAEAARAAADLSASLATAADLLAGHALAAAPPRRAEPPAPASGAAPGAVSGDRSAGRGTEVGRPLPVRRRPAPLPPGVFDDDPAAAEHLVRLSGAVVLVDGYNVSHAAWAGQPAREHRTRLVDALAELHARTGADVLVVFDGAEPEAGSGSPGAPGVRVRFSPPGVEADDVVLELIDAVPPTRPVVVASSDRRVREGARRLGANVVGARQLLAALRR